MTLAGRWVTLAPLDARKHAVSLYDGSNGAPDRERVWTYLGDGPYANLQDFRASIETKARSEDPLFFAVIDNASGRALGYQTLMRFDAANRVVEVGNVMYTPALQRTAGATEAQYLFASYVFDTLGVATLRVEVQRPQRAVAARGGAPGFHFRGRLPPAHDRQGPQPRHRLVLDAGQRVAHPQERLRALAPARQFRCRGPAEGKPLDFAPRGGAEAR